MAVLVLPLGRLSGSTWWRAKQGAMAGWMSQWVQSLAWSASSFSVASISSSSSSTAPLDNSSRLLNVEGIPGWVRTFRASARLHPSAGDPNDMGLSEHELRPDPPWPRSSPGGAVRVTGDPGVTFRSAFSWSVIGEILGSMPTLVMSNCGMWVGVSL